MQQQMCRLLYPNDTSDLALFMFLKKIERKKTQDEGKVETKAFYMDYSRSPDWQDQQETNVLLLVVTTARIVESLVDKIATRKNISHCILSRVSRRFFFVLGLSLILVVCYTKEEEPVKNPCGDIMALVSS